MKTAIPFVAVATALICTAPAQAHFLWVVVADSADGGREARFYFSETADPGSAELVNRIDPTQAWLCTPGADAAVLKLSTRIDEAKDEGALIAELPPAAQASVEAVCRYGVFSRGEAPALLMYYAKHLTGKTSAALCEVGKTDRLALDICPSIADGKLTLDVAYRGKPVGDAKLEITGPDGNAEEVVADSNGRATIESVAAGPYTARVMFIEPDSAGELDGKSYDATWHIATLTFERPADSVASAKLEGLSANDLLAHARSSRAVWENFPGFSANVTVHVDGQEQEGKVTVGPDGDVTLEGIEDVADGFIQQQLDSLVMHRMPVSAFADDDASFESESGEHVLGRMVRLADPRMGSTYRIDEDVITEVNRNAGPLRFTISVLDVARNQEGQYMPHVFTVSFWRRADGALDSNHTYYHEWTRVGEFDLPSQLIIVSTGSDLRRVVKVDFKDLSLLDAK